MIQNFFIKQNSELPSLVMKTTDYNYFNYQYLSYELENATLTFSMYDNHNRLVINNSKASIVKIDRESCFNSDGITDILLEDFYFKYDFKKKDTTKKGIYYGEFKINFKGELIPFLKGDMILPIKNNLNINII